MTPLLGRGVLRVYYWVDSGTNKIQRADLDGSNVEDLVTTGLSFPRGIGLTLPALKTLPALGGRGTLLLCAALVGTAALLRSGRRYPADASSLRSAAGANA